MYIALAGSFLDWGWIYITLQELFWIVSIAWIVIQAFDKFNGKKK